MKTIFSLLAILCLAVSASAQNITLLTPLGAAPDPTNDLMYIWDQSVGAGGANGGMKSMTPANLADYIDGATMTFTNKSMSIGQVTGLGTGVATLLATPSSANLASAITNETGSGVLVFGTDPTFSASITVGAASGTTGSILFKGTTSGTVTLKSADAAGTYTLTLPTTDGDADQVLTTNGSGVLSWAASGSGAVATDSIFDAKGDLAVGTGSNTAAKLTVGANGTILVANSGETTGLEWTDTLAALNVTTADVATFQIDSVEVTSSAAELNTLDGATLTVTELNYVDGVTSALQTQLDAKAAIAHLAGNDPDVSTEGHLGWDSNGDVLRGYDGTRQVAIGRVITEIQVVVIAPNDLADGARDATVVFTNKSGMSFVVTGWDAWSDTDDTDLNIEEVDNDGANNATVDAVSIATNGTGGFYASDSTITAATVENGHRLVLDFDNTDTPGLVHISIFGYYAADVN